ncbi:FAD-binding monooxygenase [Nocardia panacis]|uniref:FAD-binding monooxygenase n=1 Tax=Nocardia panacis TaxID=2340916 RepID=A0A3A4KJC8_9NOCA|nr:FAD-dependent monooxygenase [Nocardia panacis]RJO74992.1 FAD-binding monooxygenase [Nocardia panacis]
MNRTDVLIVGAGPTGLTLACELARRGIDHRVIDQLPHHNSTSRAKLIQPRSLEISDDLGIAANIREHGTIHVPTRHYDKDRVISEALEAAIGVPPSPTTPHPAPVWVAQPHVESALRDRLREWGGEIQFDSEVVALHQKPENVTVTLAGGTAITARYVVGCDGGRSAIRRLAGFTMTGAAYPQNRWYLGDLRIDGLEPGRQHLWMNDGILSLFPLPHLGVWQFQAAIAADEPERTPSLELYRRIFTERTGLDGVTLTDPTWLSLYRINVAMVDRYRDRRVLLAGDAAHVHSPGGGQGMNTGIQDAYNLGWKLAAVLAGAPDDLLETYGTERIPVARAVLDDSTAKLRHIMSAADGSTAQRGLTDDFTTGLTIAYPDSPLTAKTDQAPGPRPGDRAPDAPILDTTLFDLQRGTHWTILDFGHTPFRAASAVQVHRIPPNADFLRGAYHPTPDELILIRPDGHLATRTTEPADLEHYRPYWH